MAASAARNPGSGPWQSSGGSSGPLALLQSFTTLIFRLIRSCFAGPRQRRLLLVFLSAVLLTVCFLRIRNWGEKAIVAQSSIKTLSWSSPFTLPQEYEGLIPYSTAIAPQTCVSFPEIVGVGSSSLKTLPYIPPKIWQIYLDFSPQVVSLQRLVSWLRVSPSHAYTILDAAGALGLVGRLAGMALDQSWKVPVYSNKFKQKWTSAGVTAGNTPLDFAQDALQLYAGMPRRVLRADFLRYLVLAFEGGVYSDIDTNLVKPIRDWVPEPFRNRTRLIVGLEADASPPVHGMTHEVQFCQWTLASTAHHPTMWTMVERILAKVRTLPQLQKKKGGKEDDDSWDRVEEEVPEMSDQDVLAITGPGAWTDVVYEHLNQVAGEGVGRERITWKTLTGMREPRLYGDTLILPIDAFGTGLPHSNASKKTSEQTLVLHQFVGTWKDNKG